MNLNGMAKSGQSVALLQGIAKPAPALPGQSAAGVHQESSGPAPPAYVTEDNPTNKGSTTDQAHAATSILQPLPPGLTPAERDYLLADRPPRPPWGDAPATAQTWVGGGKTRRPPRCKNCSEKAGRWIHKGREHQPTGPKGNKTMSGCLKFQRQVYLWQQYYIVREQIWQSFLAA